MNSKHYMIMKTYPKILLLLAICLVATSASARKKPRQIVSNDTVYVKPYEMPNAGYYLPAPPDTASMDFFDDMIQWQWGKTQRNTPRGRQANMESPWEPYIMESIMSQCLGLDTICAEKTPALARFLKRAYNTGNKSTAAAKALYMRTRPFVQMGEDTWAKYDTEYLRTNGSYPSGHTSLGWGTALAFAEMWPELQDTIMRRAFQFGENRIITGAHYQSDVTAGYLCASAAYVRAHLHLDSLHPHQTPPTHSPARGQLLHSPFFFILMEQVLYDGISLCSFVSVTLPCIVSFISSFHLINIYQASLLDSAQNIRMINEMRFQETYDLMMKILKKKQTLQVVCSMLPGSKSRPPSYSPCPG